MELSQTALTVYDVTLAAVVALLVSACAVTLLRPRAARPEQPGRTVELAWSAVPLVFVVGLWLSVLTTRG